MTTERTTEANSNSTPIRKGKYRVLVVEDELINQHIMGAILQRLGCSVENAANGELALIAATKEAFDLIFMDIQMPVMDGIEATRQLRSEEKYLQNAQTPIIALSAYALPGDDTKWLDAGMNGHLAKPVTLISVQKILESHIRE